MPALWPALLLAGAAWPAGPKESVFRGESCSACHARIRDASPAKIEPGRLPGDAQSAVYDAIIIGGGLSGLTAALQLKDLRVLVLEKEDKPGGKVRAESWGGSRYSVAADYMGEPYFEAMTDLFHGLGLKAEPIAQPENSLRTSDGRIVHDPFRKGLSELPEAAEVKESIRRMVSDINALLADPQMGDMPPVPDGLSPLQRRLDGQSFLEHMRGRYGKRVAELADDYSRGIFGVGAGKVSALAGLVYFAADFGSNVNITWQGGPGIISEKISERLGSGRIETGALVTAVAQDRSGVQVEYWKDGNRQLRRAKTAVLAVPSFVTRRVVQGLPDWKLKALSAVRYSAYAVGIVALKEPLYGDSYYVWGFKGTLFTELGATDWGRPRAPPSPGTPAQILQLYIPLGESEGRNLLVRKTDGDLERRALAGLEKVFPGARAKVHGARIIRWGHAMPIPYPGYLSRVRRELARPVARLFFAGVDSELPAIEGAVASGHRAAMEVRRFLGAPAGRP